MLPQDRWEHYNNAARTITSKAQLLAQDDPEVHFIYYADRTCR
jgi:hypothetical protein